MNTSSARKSPTVLLAAVACLFGAGALAQIQFDSQDWSWEAGIVTRDAPDGFVRLELTPEILDASRPSLADIRIVDEDDVLVAHLLSQPRRQAEPRWTAAPLINRTFTTGEFARVTADFGGRERRNQFHVTLSGDNYRRFARLEGSEDGLEWATIDTAWLFHYRDRDRVYDATTFRFPVNDFPYLRLTAYNMEDEPDTIRIEKIETCERVADPAEVSVNVSVTPVEPEEDEGNVTLFDIDTGYRNLPLATLTIAPMTPYFFRRYELLGRDALTETYERRAESAIEAEEREVPWRTVRSGVFYRVERDDDTAEILSVNPIGVAYRYYRLRILNGDDAPLDVALQDIQVTRHALSSAVFDHRPGGTYRLYFGNPKAGAPRYDLARAFESLDERNLPAVAAATVRRLIEEDEAAPLLQRYKGLSWVVLALAVIVMAWLIGRNLRHVGRE